jgi:hypothetical protein
LSFVRIPEATRVVARAAFPKGSMCMRLRDALGTVFSDEEFADVFSEVGQPGRSPGRLALFRCVACGYTGDAEVNAARTIKNTAPGHGAAARGALQPWGGAVNREPQLITS